jgi:hypothetical protein
MMALSVCAIAVFDVGLTIFVREDLNQQVVWVVKMVFQSATPLDKFPWPRHAAGDGI